MPLRPVALGISSVIMTRALTFIALVVICGLGELPISAVVLGIRGIPVDIVSLIRNGVLVVYGISVCGSSCYTLIKEHRPLTEKMLLFTILSILALFGGAICYAVELSDAIKSKHAFAFSDFSMTVQFVCASVALLFALVIEFKSTPQRPPPGYSHLML